MRRRHEDSFPVILVRFAIQSSDMCPSNIAEVDISGFLRIMAGREEDVVYQESSGN